MDINPIYKFMKDNGLTQKDEATFVSEYSSPQKSAELHKFMVDNKLTTKSSGDFYNEYFAGSKKKEPTTQDSNEPVQQPGKPSAPSFGQKVVGEALTQEVQIPLRGQQKAPVQKKPYQDITYKREQLPSETTQMPETPVVKAAKKDFKENQIKPQVQLKSTPEELEAIEKKTETVDKKGLVLNEYQSSADTFNELNRLKKDDANDFYRNLKDARPDLYEKYSGRTIEEGRSLEGDMRQSQEDRDLVYKNYLSDLQRADENHRYSINKVTPIIDSIVDEKVTPESYGKFTTGHSIELGGDVVDMGKVDDEAMAIAEKYNLPTDGDSWRLLKNKIKSSTDFQIIKPQAEEIFKSKYPELQSKRQKMFEDGFKYDDEIYSRVESELTSLQDQYAADAKNEFNAIDAEYKSKSELLNQQYKQFTDQATQVESNLNDLYKTGQIDQLTYETRWSDLQKEKKDYFEAYKKDFPSLDEYVKKSNEINSKYNRKFELQKKALTDKAQTQISKEFDNYASAYKEDPAVLDELNKAYRESFELASDIRTKKMGLGAELSNVPLMKTYQSTLASLGGVFKGWAGSLDSKTLELLGESMEQNFMMPAARTEEFKDWLDPQNLQLLTGQLLGSMAPSMAITAAVATATGGSGVPAIVPMVTGGLAGWGAETVDIVGRSYLDMFEKTGGNVADANKAAERSLKSQYDLMFTYAFDALPFVGKVLGGIPTKMGRVAAGAGIEMGTEFLQEYPQNIAEENIQKGLDPWTNLGEALQDTKKMKQTLISIGPVAILGGAGQLGSKSARQEAVDTYVSMQQKAALSAVLPDQKRQYVQNMVFDRGGKFAKGVVGAMFANGTIDEETSKDLLVQVERSEKIQEAGKSAGLKGSKLNIYGFYSARAEEAERNAAKFGNDPILSESYKQQAKQYRDAGLDFMKGNNPDLLTVIYADGSQAMMTPEDVNGLFSNPIALTLLNKKKISVEAYREKGEGAKAIQELSERADAYKQTKRYTTPAKRGTSLEYWQGLANRRMEQLKTQQPELSEDERLVAIKKIEDEVNTSFQAQIDQEKQRKLMELEQKELTEKQRKEEIKRIEEEETAAFKIKVQEFEQKKRDQRDIDIEQMQQQRESLGVSEVNAFFSDMKPLVGTTVERMEQGKPAPKSAVKVASDYLYAKYKELTAMKSDPNRMMTIAQIESIQAQIEQDLETLEGNPPSQKIETNDQENVQGVPGEVGEGKKPVAAEPVKVPSTEAPEAGGVLQAPKEEVTPTTETTSKATPAPKPSLGKRLRTAVESSEIKAAEDIARFLEESGIDVQIIDSVEAERIGQERNIEGSIDGIFFADKDSGTIYLNRDSLKGKDGATIAYHEGIHPVINIIRNTNPELYGAIVAGIREEAKRNPAVARVIRQIESVKEYQKRGPEAIEDEIVVETLAQIASGGIKLNELDKTLKQKMIEFFNKLVERMPKLAAAFNLKPIKVDATSQELLDFSKKLSTALTEGGRISDVVGAENVMEFAPPPSLDIKEKENISNYEENIPILGVIRAGQASVDIDRSTNTPIDVYQEKGVKKLPVKTLKQIYDKFKKKVVVINSDPTRVGWLTLPSGKRIFMYGGPGYLSVLDNTKGDVGFATTQESKVKSWKNYVDEVFGNNPGVTLVATQAPTAILSNSYALRYVLDAISQLPKSVLKSSTFKNEFFGKDVTLLKSSFGEKKYKEFISKYKNADLSNPEIIDNMISEMSYTIGNDNAPASFKARGAFVANLLGGLGERSESKTVEGDKGYYSKKPQKYIASQLMDRLGINAEKVMRDIGEPGLIDLYINEGKWGFAVSGFETDPNIDIKSVQNLGVDHPLFNAKFPGKNAFLLDGAYEIDEMFKPIEMTGPKGAPYTKRASLMLSGSMYVKGGEKQGEQTFEYRETLPSGIGVLPAVTPERITKASENLQAKFRRDGIPLSTQEAVEIVEELSSWKDWYEGIAQMVQDNFGEYAADYMMFMFGSAVAATSSATIGTALNNLERLYAKQEIAGLPIMKRNIYEILSGLPVTSDKIANFIAAGLGDKNAIPVDMHVWSFINSFPTTKKSPSKKDFDKAKEFVRAVADGLGWDPREVQAAMWAANMLRLDQRPDTYEEYIQKKIDAGLQEQIQGWRDKGYKPVFEVRQTGEKIETVFLQEEKKAEFTPKLEEVKRVISPKGQPSLIDRSKSDEEITLKDGSKVKPTKISGQTNFFHASSKKREGKLKPNQAPQWGKAIYFATSRQAATDEFGGDNVTEASLNLKKPAYTNTKEFREINEKAAELYNREMLPNILKEEAELVNGKWNFFDEDLQAEYDKNGYINRYSSSDIEEGKYFGDAAKELGYDAIIDEGGQYGTEIAVLDENAVIYPEDIKTSTEAPKAGSVGVVGQKRKVYHGADEDFTIEAKQNRIMFTSKDKKYANYYAKQRGGKVFEFDVDESKIAREDYVKEKIKALDLKTESGEDVEIYDNLHRLIDPRFEDTSISKEGLDNLFSELEKEGYYGVDFMDENQELGGMNEIESTAIFNPKELINSKGQLSLIDRSGNDIGPLIEEAADAVEQAIASGTSPQQALDEFIGSQEWYSDLTPGQRKQIDDILQEEFGTTPKVSVKKLTGIKATISNIIDNYYKLKDGDRSARDAINQILDTDPKLKYIYDNISRINKQLQDAGVITDKTDGCP